MPSISQEEISKYWEIFQQQNPNNGLLNGQQAMGVLQNSQLPHEQLEKVWDLSDIDGDGQMDFEEFCIAMRLVFDQLKNPSAGIPRQLPQWLVPASKQHLMEAKLALSGNNNNFSSPTGSAGSTSLIDDDDITLRSDFDWYISPANRREYEAIYSINSDSRGGISFDSLTELYATLDNVPVTDVSSAWNLVNPKSEEKIDKEQCIVFLHILSQRDKGVRLPRSVPASLRATFQKSMIDYDYNSTNNSSSSINQPALQPQPTSQRSFAEGYMSRLGLGGRSSGFKGSGTDSSSSSTSTKDSDWEEARLRRELRDLEARLDKIEQGRKQRRQRQSSGSGGPGVVRRELQLLLEYKEKQLKNAGQQGLAGDSQTDLASAREEVNMIAEQMDALKEHYSRRREQLAALQQELAS